MLGTSHASAPKLTFNFSLCFVVLGLFGLPLQGQETTANNQSLLRAIELIDSGEQSEREASEQAILAAAKRDPKSQLAALGLILIGIQNRESAEALKWIKSLPSPEKLAGGLRTSIAKIELCTAIAAPNSEIAEAKFKEIVKTAINEKVELGTRREYTELAGGIIELLLVDPDKSPIKKETLTKANSLLTVSANSSLVQSYQSARKVSEKKAYEIREWSEKLRAMSNEERDKTIKELNNELAKDEEQLVEAARTASKANNDQKEAHKTQVIGSKKLQAEQKAVSAEPVSAGHPGPEPQAPRVPQKQMIRVKDFRIEYDKDGKEKRVARGQQEMDRERDALFVGMMQEYNLRKLEYDRSIASYRELFKAWTDREQERRTDVKKRLESIKESIAKLIDEEKEAEAERKTASEALRAIREAVKDKRWVLKIASLVADSMNSNSKGSAFCEACLNLLSVSDEKQTLLKAFASQDKATK